MLAIEKDLYVSIHELQCDRGPFPRPLQSGFSIDMAYRVLGLQNASESSEAFMILANDRDEIWFIPTRHLRVHALNSGCTDLRYPCPAPQDVASVHELNARRPAAA